MQKKIPSGSPHSPDRPGAAPERPTPALRFGQGPRARIRITPAAGPAGTTFTLNVVGLVPGEVVQVMLLDPYGRPFASEQLIADINGSLGAYSLRLTSDRGWPAGTYQVVIRGGDPVQHTVEAFDITR